MSKCLARLPGRRADGLDHANRFADVVPKDQRAGAIGLYYTVTGMGQLRLPSCWAAVPVKSRISRSPSTVA